MLVLQALQQQLAGRAGVDHDGVAVVDEALRLAGDDIFALVVDVRAADVGDFLVCVLRDDGTAIAAPQQVLRLQLLEIAANRLLRDLEELCQLRDVYLAFPGELLHDLLPSFYA